MIFVLIALCLMEFLRVYVALLLNISMTSSVLSVVTKGFLETVLTPGIPLNVGSTHTLSSYPTLTLLGSPDTLKGSFFFFCFILPFSSQLGGFLVSLPKLNLPILIGGTVPRLRLLEEWCSPLATNLLTYGVFKNIRL